jgi:hypothetical protein
MSAFTTFATFLETQAHRACCGIVLEYVQQKPHMIGSEQDK